MAGKEYRGSEIKNVDQFLSDAEGLESEREKEIRRQCNNKEINDDDPRWLMNNSR